MPASALKLIREFHDLSEADREEGYYLSGVLNFVPGGVAPGALVRPTFVLSTAGRLWLERVEEISAGDRSWVAASLPQAAGAAAFGSIDAPTSRGKNQREDTARRFLSLAMLPDNDLAILAGVIHCERSGEDGFKTSDAAAILKQHRCDVTNVSATLRAMTTSTAKTPAKLVKADDAGVFRFTEAGAKWCADLLEHDSAMTAA